MGTKYYKNLLMMIIQGFVFEMRSGMNGCDHLSPHLQAYSRPT